MSSYSVRDEHAPRFGRQVLTLWSGGFCSDHEGEAVELPGHDGYVVTMRDQSRIRVVCASPRTTDNFEQVDSAINAAIIDARLEHLRGELRAECISLGELIELQGLAGYIKPGDTELLEAAGVPEFPDDPRDRMYDVRCDFGDGTFSVYEYMSLLDTLTIIETFDNLDVVKCSIEAAS